MVSDAVKRRVQRAKAAFEEHSAALFKQHLEWKDQQKRGSLGKMFPSSTPGGRGATSPLGGLSPDEAWSGKKEVT
jgi:hypothetical protein